MTKNRKQADKMPSDIEALKELHSKTKESMRIYFESSVIRTIEMVEFREARIGKQKRVQHVYKCVGFPPRIYSYFNACKKKFTNQDAIAVLNSLYETEIWDDIKFSINDIKLLLPLCDEVLKNLEAISDYSIFDVWKVFGINKGMLHKFAFELSDLLSSALENDKPVWSFGE